MPARTPDVERLLTIPELADRLQVPVGTIYQWRSRKIGPKGITVGRYVRYRERDLETWLDAHADRVS